MLLRGEVEAIGGMGSGREDRVDPADVGGEAPQLLLLVRSMVDRGCIEMSTNAALASSDSDDDDGNGGGGELLSGLFCTACALSFFVTGASALST